MADPPERGWSKDNEARAERAGKESWAAWITEVETQRGYPVCGRSTRRGTPCKRPAGAASAKGKETGHLGTGACGDHGGLSPAGPASGTWKDGRRSKYNVTGRLADTLARLAHEIDEATDLTEDLRMIDALLVTVVEELPDMEPARIRERISSVRDTLRRASSGDAQAVQTLAVTLRDLDTSLQAAEDMVVGIGRFVKLADAKRKMAETETRRRERERGAITWVEVDVLAEKLRAIMLRYVPPEHESAVTHEWVREISGLATIDAIAEA